MKKGLLALAVVTSFFLGFAVKAQQPPPDTDFDARIEALLKQGRYLEVLPLARQAVESTTEASETLRALRLRRLGVALSECGKKTEAQDLLVQSVQVLENNSPRDIDSLASTWAKLGKLLVDLGEFKKAELGLRSILVLRESKGATEDKAHADVLEAIGYLYLAKLENREAQTFFEHALVIRRRIGADQDVAWSLYQLAALLEEQGQRQKAQSLIEESRVIFERILGPDHPALINLLVLQAWDLLNRRDAAKAQSIIDRQFRIAEASCGPESSMMTAGLMQRALVHLSAQQKTAARADADLAVRLQELSIGPSSPRLSAWVRMKGDILTRLRLRPTRRRHTQHFWTL